MVGAERCKFGGSTKDNDNCTNPAPDDGLPVQCIGAWSTEKHVILRKYLSGSGGPRSRYLPPKGPGGATFIDLFAGPGRARVRTSGQIVDGSPLIALAQPVNFTRLVFCEIDPENAKTLNRRVPVAARDRVSVIEGDCNQEEQIDQVVRAIPEHGLNVALIDPYKLEAFRFETIARLARFKHMDLVVFFPIGEIKRNLEQHRATYSALLDQALGTDKWRSIVGRTGDVTKLMGFFKEELQDRFGYTPGHVRTTAIRNEKNVPLYHLVFASKHPRGDAIWNSINKRTPAGQGWLPYE